MILFQFGTVMKNQADKTNKLCCAVKEGLNPGPQYRTLQLNLLRYTKTGFLSHSMSLHRLKSVFKWLLEMTGLV